MTISPVSPKSPHDLKTTAAIKDEIAAIWSQVQARVVQLAGGDPSQIQQDLSIDAVLARLDQAQSSTSPESTTVRNTVNTTLKFIDTVGSIVAGGAAEVFGPAELCFNALSFVIHAWQGYQGIFSSLADLLEKCGQYLNRLDYYMRGAGMDARLAKVACQHLQLFVEICDHAIKLRQSKRRKLAAFAKGFFLGDNDIEDLLESMAGLVDHEGRLVSAQTFSFASAAALGAKENLAISRVVNSKIDLLIANRSDQGKESDSSRRREIILRTLAFDENKLDRETKEPDPSWQRAYHNFRKLVVPGTGQWCFDEPLYVAWESGKGSSPPILAIEGVEGSGKSYLASTVIRRLRNRSSVESSGSRALLAFYFLEGDSKEELKRTNHLDIIAKSLVWQFAQADASYLKSAANICEKTGDLDPHEIPEKLLFNKDLARVIDATYFIVINGVGDIIGDALIKFLQRASTLTPEHQRIRVLLTGRPRAVEQLAAAKDVSFEKINISTHNKSDVEKYTKARMDQIEALKDTNRLGVPALRQKICDCLCEKTAGDYFRINTILKHISTLDYVHDIDKVLEGAGKERSEQIQGEIEKLNSTLGPKEIVEVNEIILWILYGREWFKPRQMAAVLYQKTGELSLLPLETKLQIRYTLFEADSDGDIDFRSYEIADLIPERHHATDTERDIATNRVKPSEVAIVKHFLSTVCPRDLYDRFDFEAFFDQKLRGKGGHISRDDKDSAEIKLAVTCLRILTEERDERQEILRPYAVSYVLQHMAAVDLAFVNREWKSAVGPRLLKLFTDDASMDALLWAEDVDNVDVFAWQARVWLDGQEGTEEVLRWFRDSAVVESVEGKGRAWIADLMSKASPETELIEPFAKRMAVHWLREESPQTLACNAFSFVLGCMRKRGENEKEKEKEETTVEAISSAEDWSRDLLNFPKPDSLWEVQVATVLLSYSFTTQAQKRCRLALTLDDTNWRASFYLARTVSDNEAIDILETATQRLREDAAWMQGPSHRKAMAEMLFDLGQRYWAIEDYKTATQFYTRSLEANDDADYDRALAILEKYHSHRRWTDIVALLETLQHCLPHMLVTLAARDTLHEILLQTALEKSQFTLLETIYGAAIQLATTSGSHTTLYYTRYYYATALLQHPETQTEDRALALWELALKEDLPRSLLDTEAILPSLTLKLAPIYLRRARAAPADSDTARTYLTRISDILPDEVAENNILFPAKLYLARYYQVTGSPSKAKQIARSVVKLALEILSDDDLDNDYLAYWRLLLVFLPLDDDKNALAAVSMAAMASRSRFDTTPAGPDHGAGHGNTCQETTPQLNPHSESTPTPTSPEYNSDSEQEQDQEPEQDYPPVFAVCDGECGHSWTSASEMWWCKDCINLTFDRGCYEKLQAGTLPLKICDKGHEFLFVPGEDDKGVARGFVPVGGRAVSVEEWKREIRRDNLDG